jgi:predicted Fe-S protein YdhL (DUF1289 family)
LANIIDSPCIKICKLDSTARFCVGCLRTREEIGLWSRYSPAERLRVMTDIKTRKTSQA